MTSKLRTIVEENYPLFGGARLLPMTSNSRLVAALPRVAVLIGCLLAFPAQRLGPPITFFKEKGGIARAVETLRAKGGFARVLWIDIGEGRVSVEAQDPNTRQRVNRWTLTKQNFSTLHWEAPFQRSGRVSWEIDGRENKAYVP